MKLDNYDMETIVQALYIMAEQLQGVKSEGGVGLRADAIRLAQRFEAEQVRGIKGDREASRKSSDGLGETGDASASKGAK